MKDDINQRIARRVRELRATHRLSLTGLSVKSGVSRSMISLIERGESSPTAAVLEKLAAGLDTSLAGLFDPPAPVARHADQVEWRDPESGYRRRNVTPPGLGVPFHIVEVRFPGGRSVTFDNHGRDLRLHQQVWMLAGRMEVTCGTERHLLAAGDCLAMHLDRITVFRNPTPHPARYAVVIATRAEAGR